MSRSISRRRFIQYGGLAGTAIAVSGCTINFQRSETLEPYVVPPEEALPGENVWYASTCRQCPAGCGIIVRVSNGRARKIEGNPEHPLNRGKLCARGQSGLQALYNPDRLRNAVRQSQRGSREFSPLQWEEALTQVVERMQAARPGAVAFYGRLESDSLSGVVGPFLKALGAASPVWYDPLVAIDGRGVLANVTAKLFGTGEVLPAFDLASADVVLSFGASFTESWLSPVAYGRAFGEMRGGALGKRGYLVQLEPRMSATGAVSDLWVPITPGTEGSVALAIGKVMVDEGYGRAAESPYAGVFSIGDVNGASQSSGVSVDRIRELARIFASYDRPVAIPGGGMAGHTNGVAAVTAVMALNALAGHIGDAASSIGLLPAVPGSFSATMPSAFSDVRDLIQRMKNGEIDVLFIHGNPMYELPIAAGFAEGLANVPFVVSFGSEVDESVVHADLVLPDHNYLESWGYELVSPAADRPVISGSQPVVTALYDTRATTDVFLDLAQRLGGAVKEALPWQNSVDYLKAAVAALAGHDAPYDTQNGDTIWAGWRQHGGYWPTSALRETPSGVLDLPTGLAVARPAFDGEGGGYPYLLYPYLSASLSDGRGASQPWLQEAPDPMTTGSWDTWVELNPETAARLGVQQDELVRIVSPTSEIVAIVYIYRAIRPDVVAVPLGQGHNALGRYATDRGANVMAILSPLVGESGELAWGATRVKVEPLGRNRTLPRIESNVGVDFASQNDQVPG